MRKRFLAMLMIMAFVLSGFSTSLLAATWTINATLVFVGNGGTFNGSQRVTRSYTGTATTGGINNVTCTIPSDVRPSRTGYNFLGWCCLYEDATSNGNVIINFTKADYTAGQSVYIGNGESRYMHAVWEIIKYDITYDYKDGVTGRTVAKKSYGSNYTISKQAPVREGYDFLGWDTKEQADTVVWNAGDIYKENKALTLYAVWKPHTYTITYHDNGGGGSPNTQIKTQDIDLRIPNIKPSRTGFEFLGWSEEKDAFEATFQPGDLLENRKMDLYAVWRIVLPTDSVDVVGCSASEGDQTVFEDIFFSTGETIRRFNIVMEYPTFLKYNSYTNCGIKEDIYVAERTEGDMHVLEISCYSPNGLKVEGTKLLGRFLFDVTDSDTYDFGKYNISMKVSSSYYIGSSNEKIVLNYAGKQEFNYLPYSARAIEISGAKSISQPTAYTVVFTPKKTTNQAVKWSIDDESVASVSKDGVVMPHKNGLVTLEAKTLDGSDLSASFTVEIVGQKTKIEQMTIPGARWKNAFSSDRYEYIVYIPDSENSISVTAVFGAGSLLCEGYGYCDSGIERKFVIGSDMQSLVFIRSEEGYSDTRYVISVIKVSDKHSHFYTHTVIEPATCTQEGIGLYQCDGCGDSYTGKIPATGHYNKELRGKKEATCVSEGYTGDIYCTDCGTQLEQGMAVPKSGTHTWNGGEITLEATATSNGIKTYTCIRCGETKTEEILAKGDNSIGGGTDEDEDTPENQIVNVSKITITASSKEIAAGKKVQLTANILPETATNQNVKWTTSNKKYAVVSAKGVVTTKKAGAGKTVTITAKAADGSGVKASVKIKIMKNAVTGVKITNAKKTLAVGSSMTLKAVVTVNGKNANKKVTWTISNANYATVSAKGKVTAKRAGKGKTVTITATSTDGTNKKSKVKVKIK